MFGFPELLFAAIAPLISQQAAAAAAPPVAQMSPYRIDVSLLLYRGEEISARAGSGSENNIQGYVWMDGSGCLAGAGGGTTAPPPIPGMRWHYTGAVTRQSGSEVTVDVTWQRVSEPANGAQHREVTIHPGESVTLEAIQVPASNSCGITAARLSLSMGLEVLSGGRGGRGGGGARGVFTGGGGGGMGAGSGVARGAGSAGGTGAGGAGAGGRGGNAGTGAGTGTGVGAGSGVAATGAGGGGRAGGRGMGGGAVAAGYGGRGTNVAANVTLLARAMGGMNRDENGGPTVEIPGVAYDAELWLVHTAPGITAEETQRLPVRVTSAVDVVTFAPVSVQTNQGPATVEIAGVVRVMATTDNRQVLRVVIARSVRGTVDSMGNTMKVIPTPAIGDVVSFEIPEWWVNRRGGGGANADPLGGHQFSVRLRLKSKGI